MMEKLKSQREEIDRKLSEFVIKLKKKVGINELLTLEKSIVEKLDNFLADNEKSKA